MKREMDLAFGSSFVLGACMRVEDITIIVKAIEHEYVSSGVFEHSLLVELSQDTFTFPVSISSFHSLGVFLQVWQDMSEHVTSTI